MFLSKLKDQCEYAAAMCVNNTYDKIECIYQYIRDRGQVFCTTDRFNLVVAPYGSDTSFYTYGGAQITAGTAAICSAYCIDD